MKTRLLWMLGLVAAIVLLPGFASNTPDTGNPLGCRQVGANTQQCEYAVDLASLAASTSTVIWAYDIAPNDHDDFAATVDMMIPGTSAASGHAWWVRSFRGAQIAGTFTDPGGTTSDTANSSSVGSGLSGAAATLSQVGSQMQVSVSCPVAPCAAAASVSLIRHASPPAVLSVNPSVLPVTVTSPTVVTITGTPGIGQFLSNGIFGSSFLATPPSVAGIPLANCSSPSIASPTITCIVNPGTYPASVGDVVVGGTALPLKGGFTFGACTLPTLASINVPMGTSAGGETFTLTGTGYTGTPSVSFGGLAGTSVTLVNSTTLTVHSPAGMNASLTPINVSVTTCGASGTVPFYVVTSGYQQFNDGNFGVTTSGSNVVSWLDQSGNSNAMGGATSHQPTTIANYNGSGRAAIALNGSPQYLVGWNGSAPVNTQPSIPNQPFTVFWVGDVSAAGGKFWDTGASSTEYGSYSAFRTGGVKTTMYAGTLVDNSTTGPTAAKTDVHEVCYNGATSNAWINETHVLSGVNPGTSNAGASSGITIGAAFSGANPVTGDVGAYMVYPADLCTAGTDAVVRNALEHVWNITSLTP